jgi:hypothetical protein
MPVEGCWLIPKKNGTDKMEHFQKFKKNFLHLIIGLKKKFVKFFFAEQNRKRTIFSEKI